MALPSLPSQPEADPDFNPGKKANLDHASCRIVALLIRRCQSPTGERGGQALLIGCFWLSAIARHGKNHPALPSGVTIYYRDERRGHGHGHGTVHTSDGLVDNRQEPKP